MLAVLLGVGEVDKIVRIGVPGWSRERYVPMQLGGNAWRDVYIGLISYLRSPPC